MENTAKNFALQLGSLISLYVSIAALITLLFGIINVAFPDAAEGYYAVESATAQIRFSIAILFVFFPTYVLLTRLVNVVRRREQGVYLTLTKWLIYLSLLIGGAVILGDVVAIINAFLNGELVTRFLFKALTVLIVVGTAFFYYLLDARGFWQAEERKSIAYGAVSGFVVVGALILGIMNIETPAEVREMRIDEQEVQALSNIQSRIQEYYYLNNELPQTLQDAYAESGTKVPQAPEGRAEYTYRVTDPHAFELCAEFKSTSRPDTYINYSYTIPVEKGNIRNPYSWDHGIGEWCFDRIIEESISIKE